MTWSFSETTTQCQGKRMDKNSLEKLFFSFSTQSKSAGCRPLWLELEDSPPAQPMIHFSELLCVMWGSSYTSFFLSQVSDLHHNPKTVPIFFWTFWLMLHMSFPKKISCTCNHNLVIRIDTSGQHYSRISIIPWRNITFWFSFPSSYLILTSTQQLCSTKLN